MEGWVKSEVAIQSRASWSSLLSKLQDDDDQYVDCSIEELLKASLEKAEQILTSQHQHTIRLAMQRLEASSAHSSEIARLSQENETLRTQLASFAGSGDAAAGSAASTDDTCMMVAASSSDQVLRMTGQASRRRKRPHAVSIVENDRGLEASTSSNNLTAMMPQLLEGKPVRPESHGSLPVPPPNCPPSLPGEMDPEPLDGDYGQASNQVAFESVEEDVVGQTLSINRPAMVSFQVQDSSGRDSMVIDSKDPFQLLEVWQHHGYNAKQSERGTASPLHLKMRRAHTYAKLGFEEEASEQFPEASQVIGELAGAGRMSKFIVHPYDPKRSIWDFSSLFLVLWDMVMIPLGLFELPETTFLVFMAWMTRLFWSMDMPISFVSGYVTADGNIELRFSRISRKYMRTWFALDVLVVGVDWLELFLSTAGDALGFARFGKASRVFRILRMVRLLRLARMTEVVALLTERTNSERMVIVIDIVKLMTIMVATGHLIACLWYAIANAEGASESWLTSYEFRERPLDIRYTMSLRWSISQFSGGMDEVTPKCLPEHVYAIFISVVAFWSGAVFLSILTSSMTQWYIIGSQQAQQLTVLRRYLSMNGISKKLALRVQRNAQHAVAEQTRAMPEAAVHLITKVSEPLKIELHFEMYAPNLSVHQFFHRYIEECPHVMRKVCHSAMQMSAVSLGDIIFNVGESPSQPKMYIVSRGKLSYTAALSGETTAVEVGQWVSEPTLWVQWVHRGTLSAMADCRLFSLLAGEFQTIVGHFEHVGFDPRIYAQAFVECLNDADIDVTDLQMDTMSEKLKRNSARWGEVSSSVGTGSFMRRFPRKSRASEESVLS